MISLRVLGRAAPTLVFAALMALGLGLSSCISLFPKTAPVTLYRFAAHAPVTTGSESQQQITILNAPGLFTGAAAGDRILTITGSEAAYIGGARWVSPATTLFGDVVNSAVQSTPSLRPVAMGEMTRPDFILRVDVPTFEARYLSGPTAAPTVVVQARASLTNARTRASAGSRLFEASIPAGENRVTAIVAAYDAALTQVAAELREWLESHARS